MSTIVKFIDADYIKNNSVMEYNVDDSKLSPIVIKVQTVYLQQMIGSSFLNHLYNAFSTSAMTSDERSLVIDYIQPYVSEYSIYEVLPFLNYNLTNKSISKKSSEFSQPSDLNEVKYLRSNIKDMAEFYGERLAKFLCDNSTKFPQYTNPTTPENLIRNSKSFFSGIYIPKGGGKDDYDRYYKKYN